MIITKTKKGLFTTVYSNNQNTILGEYNSLKDQFGIQDGSECGFTKCSSEERADRLYQMYLQDSRTRHVVHHTDTDAVIGGLIVGGLIAGIASCFGRK